MILHDCVVCNYVSFALDGTLAFGLSLYYQVSSLNGTLAFALSAPCCAVPHRPPPPPSRTRHPARLREVAAPRSTLCVFSLSRLAISIGYLDFFPPFLDLVVQYHVEHDRPHAHDPGGKGPKLNVT